MLNSYQRARILLGCGAGICFLLFWQMGQIFRVPVHGGYEDSVLQQPSSVLTLVLIAITLAVCTAIGTLFAGMVRFNGGLAAACIGMAALSVRGGSSRAAIFWAEGHGRVPGIFGKMAIETVILGAMVAGLWWVLRRLYLTGKLKDREGPPDSHHTAELHSNALPSLGVQTLATLILVMLLTPAEAKAQALVAVFIASWGGSVIAHQLFPTSTSAWYFVPPLIVGVIGYTVAWFNPDGAAIASLSGTFAPLARPLPLDYASAGIAAAIIGHWTSRRWQREKQAEAAAAAAAASA
jgi:hypothetical protein